jgi:hypothetical protein
MAFALFPVPFCAWLAWLARPVKMVLLVVQGQHTEAGPQCYTVAVTVRAVKWEQLLSVLRGLALATKRPWEGRAAAFTWHHSLAPRPAFLALVGSPKLPSCQAVGLWFCLLSPDPTTRHLGPV